MKVLTVSSAKFGVKNVVYNLLSHLTEQDVSCTYLTLPIHEVPENCDEEFLLSESLLHTLERFRPLYLGYGIFNFWRCAYRYMATNGTEFDVIWLHNPRLLPLLPESIENRLLITYHSHLMHRKSDHHSFPTSLYYRLIGQVEKRGLAKTSGVRFTVVYEPVLEELRDLDINPDRITYIGNGVDLNMFHPNTENQSLRHQWDLPASQILLFLGRLVEEKRPLGLLETFNQLSDLLNNELSLVITGNGPLESKAHKFVSQNDLQNVRFLGYVDHEKTPSLYANADYYVLPSRYEGEPLSLYEAMASGLPCIVSDIPNLQFINSEDCGITVDFSTPDQAATDLMRYIETGNPDKHASNARSYAESHLGWTSRSEEYYDPLKTIATNEE